jgi:hypothetical protein
MICRMYDQIMNAIGSVKAQNKAMLLIDIQCRNDVRCSKETYNVTWLYVLCQASSSVPFNCS